MVDDPTLDALTAAFYDRAEADPVIGPVIRAALPAERRAQHLVVFREFWSSFLGGTQCSHGDVFAAHAGMALEARHFERWLEIFAAVAAERLPPEVAGRMLAQARHMGECLQGKGGRHHRVAWPLGRAVRPPVPARPA